MGLSIGRLCPWPSYRRQRPKGNIRQRGRTYQVRVYAGVDPVIGKPNYLTGSAATEDHAERLLRKLLSEVDDQRHTRTKATLGAAVDAWLAVHEAEENTRKGYETHARLYIKPALGDVPLGKINAQQLETLYAQLRRCRVRCNGKVQVDHLVDGPHECRTGDIGGRRAGRGHGQHDCAKAGCVDIECPSHKCQPLSSSTIRQIHIAISAALSAAVRWEWKSRTPPLWRKPRQAAPAPTPP